MPAAVILAAGLGTRMRSALPKVLHPLGGRPMLAHLLETAARLFDRIVVVTGPGMEEVARLAAPHAVALQQDRLGTGHAARMAAPLLAGYPGDVAILYGDNPLIGEETLRRLIAARSAAELVLLAMRPADPGRYGRVVTDEAGDVRRIVEWRDATEEERAIPLCNAGGLCAAADRLFGWLARLRPDNAAGEYYLTDVVALAVAEGLRCRAVEGPAEELAGINSRAELAAAEALLQRRWRQAALEGGATLIAPDTVHFSHDTQLAPDVLVEPHVVFGPGVRVESGALIRAFSHLEGCVVRAGAIVGPFARLRPGTVVGEGAHVGNFVEIKAATLGPGAKANHLTYLGDASIGAGSNIGAGTITCNYDGQAKHRTEIGAQAFIGSNTALVAPVRVGDGALVAAGSTITEDVPADALAIARGRQVIKPGRGARQRKGGATEAG
ncbi:MAG: bifunctional UDP-N-acetylglucosamine diphosphorylase/glucosamine-1-phosphate N-acetyltransferase GlmU [Rhodovarius sp.]|nr:bifunctional UDP-N-acetylglucosamine diphosphorylase/glucosamine-1-phosphate N-acetyltransferase GlmU [Rhodovarius sp.]MCX7932978.1 bifunctional UDP-N-acetylglucosamine diphosphorylase/glucosamine-1-phosphate N-acetyltransferase GlmU [Rhodovarius sp.]MDW8313754.1 bifunctional UDP-N-acetylglucosamine diphosphorylase/glucosamine-1-phosphate N-acetyltransferase GlmU [Rhodovarius sp.]